MLDLLPATNDPETLDRLAGEWWIHQLARGHRYSTDDVLCAWNAVGERPDARSVLDLGAGVGALGLMILLRLDRRARLTSVEAQSRSVELFEKTVVHNGLEQRVDVRLGDLRDRDVLAGCRFDLIAANPPYLAPDCATASPHPQRAAARLELRGDIHDYCAVAAELLAEGGAFCFTFAAGDDRPERAIEQAGLALRARRDVVFREGRGAVIALFSCAVAVARRDRPPLTVRHANGERTAAYRAVRREMLIEE